MIDYYILKPGINQNILEQFGYSRPNEYYNYSKYIKNKDRFAIIVVNKAGRFDMRGYFYNMCIEDCIKNLIEADLVEGIELDYSNRPIMEDPNEFEDNVVIGLGSEMLEEDY